MNDKPSPKPPKMESVWVYPRPPAVEDVTERIRVIFNGELIVDSRNAKRVLETSHPPTYYVPLEDIQAGVLKPTQGRSWCEWKGSASYYNVQVGDKVVQQAAWYYANPVPEYLMLKDYVAFYPNKMEACFVGEEQVEPQKGNFYGGWITSNIVGPFKGGAGTSGW